MEIKTTGLVGLGRFGSMAYRYLRTGRLRVTDTDPVRLEGIPEAASFEETVQSDVILLAVPISAIPGVCERMAEHLRPGQMVVDTCSVKTKPVQWMLERLPAHTQILGTHPLFGPDSGKDGIAGMKIAVCPVRVEKDSYARILNFLRSLRLQVIETTPEEHDRQIAQTQAVFHLIAQTLKRLRWGTETITTPGPETFFSLITTVQHDTDQLFLDLQTENPFAEESRERFINEMIQLHRHLGDKGAGKG